MAEGALFSFTSNLLSTIASPSVERAYESSTSIWEARDELDKMRMALEIIHSVIPDAEKKKEGSAAVKGWIRRVRDVLYDADDLFDEIATDQLLQMQMKGSRILKKVRISFSRLNPIVQSNHLNRRVKSIRKSLLELSIDAPAFESRRIPYEEPMSRMRRGVEVGWFVDTKVVVGRDEDLEAVVGLLLEDDPNANQSVCVIAIVGMGAVGKTTLAQLVFNNKEVLNHFENRWWARISDTVDEKELFGKIFQSMTAESFSYMSMDHVLSRIRKSSSTNSKFLLVLDDLWEDDCKRGQHLRSLLSCDGAKGSKIIITTRSSSVAMAMGAEHIHVLDGLSSNASWELFKRIAFTREQSNDPNWNYLGRMILKKCGNNPLAIICVASLLLTKTTKEEWKSILEMIPSEDFTIPVLKLSYDSLPSNLKQCFAYCSLFPKGYRFSKEQLIRLWIAQGYVRLENEVTDHEAVGEAGFMELLRRSFFQVDKEDEEKDKDNDEGGEIFSCKMHDLAIHVAREECMILTHTGESFDKRTRHLCIGYEIDDSWETLPSLIDASRRLRSFLFINGGSLMPLAFEQLTRQKFLRAVDLRYLNIEVVPNSIGELKHLRYLNLSRNRFKYLPETIASLMNLLTFDASSCEHLEALPANFNKLINLRHLDITGCVSLRYMPPGLEELTCLQNLSYFKLGKVIDGVRSSRLDSLAGLQLKGKLEIIFDNDIDEDECYQIPTSPQALKIRNYPSMRMPPHWDQWSSVNPSLLPKITRLSLDRASRIKHLPPLRCLPCLKALHLSRLDQLEYIEEEQDGNESGQSAQSVADCTMLSFPYLEDLTLAGLPKLKAWSREVEAATVKEELSSCTDLPLHQMPSFPLLSTLWIVNCPMLKSMPLPPCLRKMFLEEIRGELIQQILSSCSHSLETISIACCDSLNSFRGETSTSLQHLRLRRCRELRNLHLPLPKLNALEKLVILHCPQLKLWENEEGVEWDSLTNLRQLSLDEIPDADMLPSSLRQRQSLGKLVISGSSPEDNYQM